MKKIEELSNQGVIINKECSCMKEHVEIIFEKILNEHFLANSYFTIDEKDLIFLTVDIRNLIYIKDLCKTEMSLEYLLKKIMWHEKAPYLKKEFIHIYYEDLIELYEKHLESTYKKLLKDTKVFLVKNLKEFLETETKLTERLFDKIYNLIITKETLTKLTN